MRPSSCRRSANRPAGHSSRLSPDARPGESKPRQLLEVRERGEIDAGVVPVETMRRLDAGTERLDRIGEARRAAVELRARVPHVEGGRRPAQRPVQRREAVVVDAREVARKGPVEIVAVLEQVEDAVEVGVAGDPPRLVPRRRSRASAGSARATSPGRSARASARCRRRRWRPSWPHRSRGRCDRDGSRPLSIVKRARMFAHIGT